MCGHPAYLLGQYSRSGWWYYFPCAAFFKSTPVELVLALVVGGVALRKVVRLLVRPGLAGNRGHRKGCGEQGEATPGTGSGVFFLSAARRPRLPRRRLPTGKKTPDPFSPDWTRLVWWTAMVVYGLMMLTVRVQIGQRYLLPLYPLVILLGTEWLFASTGRIGNPSYGIGRLGKPSHTARRLIAVVLVAGQAVSALSIAPHDLAYFSPLVGGPRSGHRLLADSNLDWGQDLPCLKAELERRGWRRVLLCYFGTADPAAYGIPATRIAQPPGRHAAIIGQLDQYDCLAISVTNLLGVYDQPPGPANRRLLQLRPTARAGYSIFLYDLRDPAVRAMLKTTDVRS